MQRGVLGHRGTGGSMWAKAAHDLHLVVTRGPRPTLTNWIRDFLFKSPRVWKRLQKPVKVYIYIYIYIYIIYTYIHVYKSR